MSDEDPVDIMRRHLYGDQVRVEQLLNDLWEHHFTVCEVSREASGRVKASLEEIVPECMEAQQIRDVDGVEGVDLSFDLYRFLTGLHEAGLYIVARPTLRSDLYAMEDGSTLATHPVDRCVGPHCSVHNPSQHPLRDRQLHWQNKIMYRVCEHGQTHPDPDHLRYVETVRGPIIAALQAVHPCDGCCGATVAVAVG